MKSKSLIEIDHKKAVFLDLNGTLALPLKVDHPSELHPISGASRAVSRLCQRGYLCPVVTIQSRIEKGLFTESEFRDWFKTFQSSFLASGASLLDPYICPHRFDTPCDCKKPNPSLYISAAKSYHINLKKSYVIGDTAADVEAAVRFGGKGVLVRTGYGELESEVIKARSNTSFVGSNLDECVNWILEQTA